MQLEGNITVKDLVKDLRDRAAQVVVGQDDTLHMVLVALLCGGIGKAAAKRSPLCWAILAPERSSSSQCQSWMSLGMVICVTVRRANAVLTASSTTFHA